MVSRVFRFEIFIVHGDGDAEIGPLWMLEDMVGTLGVVNIKTGPLKSLENFCRPQSWQVFAHAVSGRAILISSLTGSRLNFLSGGKGWPSFRASSQVGFHGFNDPLVGFFIGVAFSYQTRQGRASEHIAAFFSRFKQHGVAMLGHWIPALLVECFEQE